VEGRKRNLAIRLASERGHLEIVRLLLEAGADYTANDNYAIRLAGMNDYPKVVKLLEKHVELLKKDGVVLSG
jgi:ankyrin repeat protein